MTLKSVPLPPDDSISCAPLSALPDLSGCLTLASLIGCLFSDTPPTHNPGDASLSCDVLSTQPDSTHLKDSTVCPSAEVIQPTTHNSRLSLV